MKTNCVVLWSDERVIFAIQCITNIYHSGHLFSSYSKTLDKPVNSTVTNWAHILETNLQEFNRYSLPLVSHHLQKVKLLFSAPYFISSVLLIRWFDGNFIRGSPLWEDLCATVSLSLAPVEILKGTLHSIICEAQPGSDGFGHQSKSLMCRKAFTQKCLSWDLPQRELLSLFSVLQVLVCVAAGGFL